MPIEDSILEKPDKFCYICNKPILPNEAWSYHKFANGAEQYWHYLCYEQKSVRLVPVSTESARSLLDYLRNNGVTEIFGDPWMSEVIRSLEEVLS